MTSKFFSPEGSFWYRVMTPFCFNKRSSEAASLTLSPFLERSLEARITPWLLKSCIWMIAGCRETSPISL